MRKSAKSIKNNRVIIFYGINAVGKTTLSQELMCHFEVCELQSTDNLLKIYNYVNPNNPYIGSNSCTAWSVIGDKTNLNILTGFKNYRALITEYICSLAQRAYEEQFTLVIEGVHFDPIVKKRIKQIKISPILLILSNFNVHKKRIIEKSDSRIDVKERLMNNLFIMRQIQDFLTDEAKNNGCSVVDTGLDTVEESLGKILRIVNDI